MKRKIKYFILFFCVSIIGIVSINLFQTNKDQQVKGSIELLVNDDSYDYLVEYADNFMKENDKTTISVKKAENYNDILEKINENDKTKVPNIIQLNRSNFEKLKLNDSGSYNIQDQLLNDYSKNFSQYRIDQVKYDDKSIGIPLTSRPLALYVREDMLKEYGYQRDSINTWDDVIRIGKDINTRSDGKINIINATGQDYNDLVDLLTMEELLDNDNKSVDEVALEVQDMIKKLEDNNILNLRDGGEFLARISSSNAIREIIGISEKCEWSIGNVPSLSPGGNKFFASEGDNLVVINQNNDNDKLIEKFMTYVITNNNEAVKYVEEGKFFSSYLDTYSDKEIETSVKNFVGQSPLVVLSNIEEKAPEVTDYDKYMKIKQKLIKQ